MAHAVIPGPITLDEIKLLETRCVEEENTARRYAHQEATISIPTFQMRAILAHLRVAVVQQQ